MGDRVGQRLGNYRLIRLLGRGGFGDVYLGEHVHLNTEVAIKVLQTRLVGSNLEQFRVEAQTIARLIHRHIVRIFDFGVEDEIPFLVMDYAPNGTLRQRHPKGIPVPPANVVNYVKQVASALQYAHDRKLIHRDIKPENMLLGLNGELLLSDFGLVLIAQSTGSQTTQEVAGTIPYMAPEQINGKPRPASDQYALGIVMYEWLSGERPFNGSFVEIATQHMMTSPDPLYRRVPGVSAAMEEVVFTTLAKDPQQRFARVQDLATALEQAYVRTQAHLPVSPLTITSSNQSVQPTYVVAPPGQSLKSTFVGSPSSQLSESTHVITPPNQRVVTDGLITQTQQLVKQDKIGPSSNPNSGLTGLVTQAGQTGEEASIDQFATQMVDYSHDYSHLNTIPLQVDMSPKSANSTSTKNDIVTPVIGFSTPRRRTGRRWFLASTLVLVVLLIAGGILLAIHGLPAGGPVSPGTASITITPASQNVKNSYEISAVTGTPDASQRQVQARQLSFTTSSQSQTAQATGVGTVPGAQATGTLIFYNFDSSPQTLKAGLVMPNQQGKSSVPPTPVDMMLDLTVTIPGNGNITAPSHVVQVGTIGNIPLYRTDSSPGSPGSPAFIYCQSPCLTGNGWVANNQTVFTGGQDPQNYTFVQQSDIKGATKALEANPPGAQEVLQGQIHANEKLVGTPQCTPRVTSDHQAGDKSTSVTVTVIFTCTGEVYDHDATIAMAVKFLSAQAAINPGTGYTLVGNIVTTLKQATLTNANAGPIKLIVDAVGTWVFQFNDVQKLSLAKLVVGKSIKDAQSLLSGQTGVSGVNIQVFAGNTLPTDPHQITIAVQSVPVLPSSA